LALQDWFAHGQDILKTLVVLTVQRNTCSLLYPTPPPGSKRHMTWEAAISGDLLSAVISTRYIFGFRKDNPNVFNSLIQSWPHF
jgi:hypothetical protein